MKDLLLLLCVRQPPSNEQKNAQRFCCTFGGLQSPIKWYNEKKEKDREKEGKKGTKNLDRRVGAGVSS